MDEAAAQLRMELDSLPEELDEIERRLKQLEIEREAIKREKDEAKLAAAQQGNCRAEGTGNLVQSKMAERKRTGEQDSAE